MGDLPLNRRPKRCQRSRVSGLTIRSASRIEAHRRERQMKTSRSVLVCGSCFGACRARMTSCRHKVAFSASRRWHDLKSAAMTWNRRLTGPIVGSPA